MTLNLWDTIIILGLSMSSAFRRLAKNTLIIDLCLTFMKIAVTKEPGDSPALLLFTVLIAAKSLSNS